MKASVFCPVSVQLTHFMSRSLAAFCIQSHTQTFSVIKTDRNVNKAPAEGGVVKISPVIALCLWAPAWFCSFTESTFLARSIGEIGLSNTPAPPTCSGHKFTHLFYVRNSRPVVMPVAVTKVNVICHSSIPSPCFCSLITRLDSRQECPHPEMNSPLENDSNNLSRTEPI